MYSRLHYIKAIGIIEGSTNLVSLKYLGIEVVAGRSGMIHQSTANALSLSPWSNEEGTYLIAYQGDKSNHPSFFLKDPRLGDGEVFVANLLSFLVEELTIQEPVSDLRGLIPNIQELGKIARVILANHLIPEIGSRLIVAMSLMGGLAIYACAETTETGPVVTTIELAPTSLSLWPSPADVAVSNHVYASPGGRELSLDLFLPQSRGTLVPLARDGAGSPVSGVTLTWSSSDASVATVSSVGLVSATGIGSATITASADGVTSNPVTVTVSEGPFPVIVYLHGGGWTSGNVSQFARQATHMAAKGFVGATIEYRLVPDFRFPAPVEDTKAAVRWLRANATTYRIDTDRIGVAGGSAGGHLAAMLGTIPHVAEFEGDGGNPGSSNRVQAVAAFNGPMTLGR